jgi:ankyrin repeat protein
MSDTEPVWYEFRNAVYSQDFSRADEMLKANPALLRMVNSLGETVLHYLAVENDVEGVAWLYARGSDLNTRNDFGTPVLFEVALLEYKDLFKWFVEKGADVHVTDNYGQDIVLYLLEYEHKDMSEWVRENSATP